MASENVITFTNENFENEVLKSDKLVVVDFWAQWCGPCRSLAPIIDEIADDYNGKVKVGKINVDEQGELTAKYRIMSIPTLMFFKDGQVVEKMVGARPKSDITDVIDRNL